MQEGADSNHGQAKLGMCCCSQEHHRNKSRRWRKSPGCLLLLLVFSQVNSLIFMIQKPDLGLAPNHLNPRVSPAPPPRFRTRRG